MHDYSCLHTSTSVHLCATCVRWATNSAGINYKNVWVGNCKCAERFALPTWYCTYLCVATYADEYRATIL